MVTYELPVCHLCLKPPATREDWDRYKGGEGGHLCWDRNCQGYGGPREDDRAAMLVAYEVCSVVAALLRWAGEFREERLVSELRWLDHDAWGSLDW